MSRRKKAPSASDAALVNNGGSIQMLRFFRALSIFFSLNFAATSSPQSVIPSDRIGWDSEGAAVRNAAAYSEAQLPQARAFAGKFTALP
jgi:hypothetical protein